MEYTFGGDSHDHLSHYAPPTPPPLPCNTAGAPFALSCSPNYRSSPPHSSYDNCPTTNPSPPPPNYPSSLPHPSLDNPSTKTPSPPPPPPLPPAFKTYPLNYVIRQFPDDPPLPPQPSYNNLCTNPPPPPPLPPPYKTFAVTYANRQSPNYPPPLWMFNNNPSINSPPPPPLPPPRYDKTQVTYVGYRSPNNPPPQPSYKTPHIYAPPPPPPRDTTEVTSVYRQSPNYPTPPYYQNEGPRYSTPHFPSFIEGHFHHGSQHQPHITESGGGYGYSGGASEELGFLLNKQSYKVCCKAGGHQYAVAIRNRKLVLASADPNDPTQHWIKDEKYSSKVKDSDGYPSFALVNRATGQAVQHSVSGYPVQLAAYIPNVFDGSVLWTENKDLGDGFRTIKMVNNVKLVLDAFHGDEGHGGVHDGTIVALYEYWKGDNQNQLWKFVPCCKFSFLMPLLIKMLANTYLHFYCKFASYVGQ